MGFNNFKLNNMKCKTCGQEIVSNVIKKIPSKTLEWGKTCEKELNWEDAKKWCKEQGKGWRLPTLIELLQAYEDKVDGFDPSGIYWSSVEYNANYAWYVLFASGNAVSSYKTYSNSVRCVRGK